MATKKPSKRHAAAIRDYFVLEGINIPLTDLPAPERCPFCGCRDIEIKLEKKEAMSDGCYWRAAAWCQGCGCEAATTSSRDKVATQSAPGSSVQYRVVTEAAARWNLRRDLYSQSEQGAA